MEICRSCRQPIFIRHTLEQVRLFHALATELGQHAGMTPVEAKVQIVGTWGGEIYMRRNGIGYFDVWPTSELERQYYGQLIEFTYQHAAEQYGYVFNRHDISQPRFAGLRA